MDDTEALKSLADLSGSDEKAARKALERLMNASDRALKSYLYRHFGTRYASDFEDIIQEALIKIWSKRQRFANLGFAAWHGYLQTVTKRCYLDFVLPQSERATIDYESISERELEVVIDFLNAINQHSQLESIRHAADTLWLGLDATKPGTLHRRQILAAKYFYLDGVPWDEALDLLGPLSPDGTVLTRPMLDAWLEHEGVLRGMAYDELFYSNDRLTWRLLGMVEPVQSDLLDALVRQASAGQARDATDDAGLAQEIVVILWRYRLALHPDQILRRQECIHSSEQLTAILDSLVLRFPFMKQMMNLLSCLEPTFGTRAIEILQDSGLWKRLAFQYYYGEELSLADIHDRLAPATLPVRYNINPGILNVWLSGRRLIEQLARCVARSREDRSNG